MMKHNWQIFLSGTDDLLAELREIFALGPVRLERANGHYVLRSDELDMFDDSLDVENEARRTLDRAIAIANVFLNRVGEVTINQLHCETDSHRHGRGPGLNFKFRVVSSEAAERVRRDTHELRGGLAAAIVSEAKRDDRWESILTAGWASKAELDRIKRTANRYRHARGFPLPKHPPTIGEAQITLYSVVRSWLRHKHAAV
jgi:hypothetical protein